VFPGRFRVANAGELQTKGIEVDVSVLPRPGLTISAAGAYIDAKYADFKNIACYTGQPILPFGTPRTSPRDCIRAGAAATATAVTEGTGNVLANSPRFSYTLTGRYETPVMGMKAFAQLNWLWRDKVNFSAAGDPNLVQRAYGLLGASFGFGPSDDAWQISIFGKNLLDKNFAANIISNPVLNAPGVYSQFTSPDARRTIGLAVSIRLGK
jgi:iron complex outermembrane recepter protein